ncbi:MAG: hypothetical protein N7Q72_02415, partial [Spiroplasma sp. Tabriz.8]|nr:hypothetical protein [Spiroplasma sp. Tabriz.8]
LASATDNFNPDSLVGEGGFGRVYKGYIKRLGRVTYISPSLSLSLSLSLVLGHMNSLRLHLFLLMRCYKSATDRKNK